MLRQCGFFEATTAKAAQHTRPLVEKLYNLTHTEGGLNIVETVNRTEFNLNFRPGISTGRPIFRLRPFSCANRSRKALRAALSCFVNGQILAELWSRAFYLSFVAN